MYFIKIMYRGPALSSLMLEYQLKTVVKRAKSKIVATCNMYCISANSFHRNYSFLEVGVRQVFKGALTKSNVRICCNISGTPCNIAC